MGIMMEGMVKRLHSVLFYVSDLAKTADFYEGCGLSVVRSDDGVRIKTGDFTFAFIAEQDATIKNKASNVPKGLGVYTYVEVDDADAHFAEVKRNGIEPSTEPKTWPWGNPAPKQTLRPRVPTRGGTGRSFGDGTRREFVVKDPDGFRMVFYSPVAKDAAA